MKNFKVCNVADILDGEKLSFIVNKTKILLLNLDGEFYAYEDKCPHQGVPMSEGELQGFTLTCAAHQWCFNARTGAGINPDTASLKKLPLNLENNEIFVILPEVFMNEVGPVLETGRTTDAIILALKKSNAQLKIIDKGSYQRILAPERCTLILTDIEEILGIKFKIPQDLEKIMPSFQGAIAFEPDCVTWSTLSKEQSRADN